MRCLKCQAENLEIHRFCVQCGTKLEKICPNCGASNTPRHRFCGKCGYDLAIAREPIPSSASLEEKSGKTQHHLPEGLTEEILPQRSKIEGQRKQVTVISCDMNGFTSVPQKLGQEKTHSIMDEVFDILIHRVHDYGGTVNKMTDTGIIALFGAPIAVADAPQRAIRSALAIQQEMARFNDRMGDKSEIAPMKTRIGIHTGPIVVNTLENLQVELTEADDTVNLAARTKGLAESGTTYVTEETFKLTNDLFQFEALGKKEVNGTGTPVKVYQVITPSTGKTTRFDVSGERILTPFVGKERELELLMDAEEYKASCKDNVSLKELDKNPETYKDTRVTYQGEIMRIMENGRVRDIIVDVTKDKHHWADSILVWYDGATEALENDTIRVWGEVRGNYKYTSVAGWKITLPLVRAEYVEVTQSDKVG